MRINYALVASNFGELEKEKLQEEFNDIKFQIEQIKYNKNDLNKYISRIKSKSNINLDIVRTLISKVDFRYKVKID